MPDAPTLGEITESAADSARAVLAEMTNGGVPENERDDDTVLETDAGTGTEEPSDEQGDGRPRDEKGRFVAKDKSDDDSEREPDSDGDTVSEAGSEEPEGEPSEPDEEPLEPLPEWSAEQHAEFHKLSRPAQEFLLNHVREANEKASAGSKYEAIEAELAPRRQAFARDGLDDAAAIRQVFALSDFARDNPVGFTQWFMQQRGISPDHLFGPQQQQQGEGLDFSDDPLYQHINPTIAQLQQQIQTLNDQITNRQQQERQTAQERVHSEIEAFGTATDDKGRPVHPYFNQVRSLMGTFIGSGEAPDLESAYDMACRAKPDVRAKIEAAERARADREAQADRRKKAEAASRAGKSISGSPGDRAAPEMTGDIREDMRRQFAEKGIETNPWW